MVSLNWEAPKLVRNSHHTNKMLKKYLNVKKNLVIVFWG